MRKEILRKLRTLNATKEMMEKASVNERKIKVKLSYGEKVFERKYAIFMRCQHLGSYLKIAIFLPKEMIQGIASPHYEIFINLDGQEYITREWRKGKEVWRSGKICNLEFNDKNKRNYFYYSEKRAWINQEGNSSIKKLLNTKNGGYEGILEYQEKILKERLEEKRRKETQPWDEDMDLIPEVPKGFEKWWMKEGITEHFIFYEYKRGGAKSGYCSNCEREVDISDPRHGKQGVCPRCHKKITYKATGKIKGLNTKEYFFQVVQKIKGGFVVRSFGGWKKYWNTTFDKPIYECYETKRTLYRGETVTEYNYETYKNVELRWVKRDYPSFSYNSGKVYGRNISGIKEALPQYSVLPIMIKARRTLNCNQFLNAEVGNPTIEKLVKIGMYRLAEEMVAISYHKDLLCEDASELAKILKIDGSRLNRLKAMDSGIGHLKWIQEEKQVGTIYSDEMIDYFCNKKILPSDLSFISPRMSYMKIFNYIRKQQDIMQEDELQILRTWKDYLNMAQKAKLDISHEMIYKPKNLKSAHGEAILLLQEGSIKQMANELAKKWPHVDEVCQSLKKYELQGEEYSIVAPAGIADIVREGVALSHCIHTCDFYFDRISHRESYLLFLRWTDSINTPYYTLEVEPSGNIRQKRTIGDNQNPDFQKAVKWLKKWQKEIKSRLTKEDNELGKKSNEMRVKELEDLRKNGNKIWHGKLAGQLLVDVLEADFMAAEDIEERVCV